MVKKQEDGVPGPSAPQHGSYAIRRRDRHWEVRDPTGDLVCLTVTSGGLKR